MKWLIADDGRRDGKSPIVKKPLGLQVRVDTHCHRLLLRAYTLIALSVLILAPTAHAQFNNTPLVSTSQGGIISATYGYFRYVSATSGGGTNPGGASTNIQFNDNGAFGGSANFTWNKSTNVLAVSGTLTVGGPSSGVGYIGISKGDGTHTGFTDYLLSDGSSVGYVGWGVTGTFVIAARPGSALDLSTNNTVSMLITNAGNVGIGTSSPNAKLDVKGAISATAFVGDGSGLTGITGDNLGNHTATQNLSMGANQVTFSNAAADKLYLYSNTYGLGIESSTFTNWSGSQFRWRIGGTSASTGTQYMLLTNAGLTVTGYVTATGNIVGGGNVTIPGEFISTAANQARYVAGNYGLIQRNDGSNFYLLLTASGDQYGSWNTLRPFMINMASGDVTLGSGGTDVGINTTAPNAKLDVNGVVSATNFYGKPADSASLPSFTWSGDTNTGLYTPAADAIGFTTGGTERVRITNAGISATVINAAAIQLVSQSATPLTCNSGNSGTLRYNNPNSTLELCNGTAWRPIVAGIPAISDLSDVSVSQPQTGMLLRYSGNKWEAISPSQIVSTTSMYPNFPDVIVCTGSTTGTNVALYRSYGSTTNYQNYVSVFSTDASTLTLRWNTNGTYNSAANASTWTGYYENCVNKSISQLYASGNAFDLAVRVSP